jgi:transcription antitermination factor NusG
MDEIMNHRWFALQVRALHEKIVALTLREKGHEEFLPLHRVRRRWSDRVKNVEVPLFPGYVFCRLDIERRLPILVTPGVLFLVGIGKTPCPIEDSEIAALQSVVRSGLPAEPWPFLRVGQRVRIEQGSLQGVEGILVNMKKPCRLVVSVTLLQRSVAVEIEQDWVSPIARSTCLQSSPPDPTWGTCLRPS